MKEKILQTLKTKYANLGFGQKAFDGVADYLSKTVTTEEDIETAVGGVEPLLKAFQADADKMRTEKSAAEKKLAELEAQVKTIGGAPAKKDEPDQPAPTGSTEPVPAWAKALVDANKALTERLNKLDTERTAAGRKAQLSEILGKLPESLRKGYERIPVDTLTDDQFNALKEETGKEVDAIAAEMKSRGAVFGRPAAGKGGTPSTVGEATDAEAQAVVDRLIV